jgi:L-seryl-tRNA(Ser) seleniumtransferase
MASQSGEPANPYRALPSVDRVLAHPLLATADADPALLTDLARAVLAEARAAVGAGRPAAAVETVAAAVVERLRALERPSLRPVINATGVIIHTNLGRAPLSAAARAAMEAVARGYSNLEYDLERGERGSRHTHVEALLTRATGAEAGLAVNNNAAALLLALSALCAGREVVISRAQLVEIGGGFRIPDVLRQSGARLVEVGTTNRTYLRDYEQAYTQETAAFLRVHSSNFRIIGFVEQPELSELAGAARRLGVLLLDDLGSGALLDTAAYGLAPEPTVQGSLAAGADLALFSGDKLLGGPQAGVIVGRAALVERLRRHPLARAVRPDKATIAALTATLLHYVRGEATRAIPVWRMIAAPAAELRRRTEAWAAAIGDAAGVVAERSMVGGGSLPEESLPTWALALRAPSAEAVARRLRAGDPPVVARVERGLVLLDPRTVEPADDPLVVAAVRAALAT